jgi:tRNA1(Val) A37 N6-methylase TrmN6
MLSDQALERRRKELEAELGEGVTVDGLTRTWRIFQRRRGHRHSTDDVLTAWYALETSGGAALHCLDLGTGIGTVGLLVLAGLPPAARLTCIEAQDISFRFLSENIRANGIEDRVHALHGDLRDLALGERFPLVTASPPYFDVSAGIVPKDPQKAHARFELRGTIEDYARSAERHLAGDGLFVFCFPWQQRARALDAAKVAGFHAVRVRDVVPREGLSPLFCLFSCRAGEARASTTEESPIVVRRVDGTPTEMQREVRARFGWP